MERPEVWTLVLKVVCNRVVTGSEEGTVLEQTLDEGFGTIGIQRVQRPRLHKGSVQIYIIEIDEASLCRLEYFTLQPLL